MRPDILKMAESHRNLICLIVVVMFTFAGSLPMCDFVDDQRKILVCYVNQSGVILKRGVISDNNQTEAITLRGCEITDLERDALADLSALKYLDLSQNKLTELELGVFDGIPTVLYLNLSKNYIPNVRSNVFAMTPDLLVLDLSENEIDHLGFRVFDSLRKLKTLDLSWNMLLGRDLNSSFFENNKEITYISFMGNDMNDTPENIFGAFELLETLNLKECALDAVPQFATKNNLKTLTELILSSNQISELADENLFIRLENLETLDLADNEINYVTDNIFRPLKKLKVIILRNNKLSHLPERLFVNMRYLGYIDLSHNAIAKLSVDFFLGTSVKRLDLAHNRLTYLTENFCNALLTAGANLTEFYFHKNPWQCACLKTILKEVEELHIAHKTDTPGYNDPVCVTSRDYRCKRSVKFINLFTHMYDKMTNVRPEPVWLA